MQSSTVLESEHSDVEDDQNFSSSNPQSLTKALHNRRKEYIRQRKIKIKLGTWNVAGCPGTDKDLGSWFSADPADTAGIEALNISAKDDTKPDDEAGGANDTSESRGDDGVGLYVLGLQEVVDLNMTKDYVNRTVYSETSPVEKWKVALEAALPPGYQLITAEQMTGLLLFIYASPEVAKNISNVSTKQVGTGLLGYFGNKGAVVTRLLLGDTTRLVFVNSHLASGAGSTYLERRFWDVSQVLTKTQFDPVVISGVSEDEGEAIGDEDFSFWFGDLNFRLDLPGDDIRRILTLHAQGEYDVNSSKSTLPMEGEGVFVVKGSESDDDTTTVSSLHSREQSFDTSTSLPDPDEFPEDPSQDPASLQATIDSLLPHDQLKRSMATRKVFQDGWKEGAIRFLPTYKYDVGSVHLFDSSEKQRAPSWCDRILYRTKRDIEDYKKKIIEEGESKKKDDEMKSRGLETDDDVLFSYDPENDGEDQPSTSAVYEYDEYDENEDPEPEEIITTEETIDRISLDLYESRQNVTSSDHKPIISLFTLDYDSVIPDLKAKVHAEVARELDRAENERRPGVTVVTENGTEGGANVVDLGDLAFLQKKTSSLTVANTGGVAATFAFVEKPSGDDDTEDSLHSWLKTSFDDENGSSGNSITLEPGETTTVDIDAQVSTISFLRALNDGHAKLEDVLVLRVEDGRDHFIPIHATWQPTCFGRSIDELIRVPEGGIRPFLQQKDIKGAIPYDMDVHCSAPRELFKLTEAIQTLSERCVADATMLEDMSLPGESGWPFDAETWTASVPEQDVLKSDLIQALDMDKSIFEVLPAELPSAQRLELLSSVLLLFLASLTDGLVPATLSARLATTIPSLTALPASAWPDMKAQVLDIMVSAPNHNIAFVFLTTTLARVATELIPATIESRREGLQRRLSFRKGDDDGFKKRRAREKRYAEVLAPLVFRASDKDKVARDKERTILELFLKRDAGF